MIFYSFFVFIFFSFAENNIWFFFKTISSFSVYLFSQGYRIQASHISCSPINNQFAQFVLVLMKKVGIVREVQYSAQTDFVVEKILDTGKVFPISFTCQPPLLTSPQLEQPQDQGGEASHPRRGCQPPPRGRLVSEVWEARAFLDLVCPLCFCLSPFFRRIS